MIYYIYMNALGIKINNKLYYIYYYIYIIYLCYYMLIILLYNKYSDIENI